GGSDGSSGAMSNASGGAAGGGIVISDCYADDSYTRGAECQNRVPRDYSTWDCRCFGPPGLSWRCSFVAPDNGGADWYCGAALRCCSSLEECALPTTPPSASTSARPLRTISSCPASRSESATRAPPTPIESVPSLTTAVRMTTLRSAVPPRPR